MATTSFGRRSKASAIIFGILLLVLGLWTLTYLDTPVNDIYAAAEVALFVSTLTAWGLIFAGIASCVSYGATPKENRSAADVVMGVILIVLGVIILFFPLRSWVFVVCFLGALIFLSGIADIAEAVAFKKQGASGWVLFIIFGIVTLLFGLSAFIMPFFFSWAIIWVLAFALIFDGVTEIIAGIRM